MSVNRPHWSDEDSCIMSQDWLPLKLYMGDLSLQMTCYRPRLSLYSSYLGDQGSSKPEVRTRDLAGRRVTWRWPPSWRNNPAQHIFVWLWCCLWFVPQKHLCFRVPGCTQPWKEGVSLLPWVFLTHSPTSIHPSSVVGKKKKHTAIHLHSTTTTALLWLWQQQWH
jgi:hypothetical protein